MINPLDPRYWARRFLLAGVKKEVIDVEADTANHLANRIDELKRDALAAERAGDHDQARVFRRGAKLLGREPEHPQEEDEPTAEVKVTKPEPKLIEDEKPRSAPLPSPKKRGRKPGSKNKPKPSQEPPKELTNE